MDDSRRCTAHSSQTGERCRKPAIRGGTVCGSHGGSAPQVRDAAKRRLIDLVDPALARLQDLLDSSDERIRLQACRLILDKAQIDDGEILITEEILMREVARLEAELDDDPHHLKGAGFPTMALPASSVTPPAPDPC